MGHFGLWNNILSSLRMWTMLYSFCSVNCTLCLVHNALYWTSALKAKLSGYSYKQGTPPSTLLFGYKPLSDIWFAIFFPILRLSFHCVRCFFCCAEPTEFEVVPFVKFSFCLCSLHYVQINDCQDQYWGASSLCFLIGVLWYQVFCVGLRCISS